MRNLYKLPLVLTPQSEGGYTVTCPLLPELVTEGDSVEEVMDNAADALAAIIEAYGDLNRPLPAPLRQMEIGIEGPIWLETLISVP